MQTSLAWLPSGTFEPRRYKPGDIGNWSGHLSFARDLVIAARPTLFCELGTHWGESYFGFCQAISENDIPATAYAVDTWRGEAQSGFYGEDIYQDVSAYNEANYNSFSYLVRSLFNEALQQFSEESIDILHIDGLHTYEAVSHDLQSWLPKVKPGGIVLLHDIAVRHLDFGVWRLWEELRSKGATFEFHHSWGLGVFEKPGRAGTRPDFLEALLGGDAVKQEHIRRFYFLSSLQLEWMHATQGSSIRLPGRDQIIQVYRPGPEGYQEQNSERVRLAAREWQRVSVEFQSGLHHGKLRIDPGDGPAITEIRGITIRSAVDRTVLWTAGDADLNSLAVGGTLVRLDGQAANGASRFFSYGTDPQLYLPELNTKLFDQPLVLEMWIRLQTDLSDLLAILEKPEVVDLSGETADLRSQVESLHSEITAERENLQRVLLHVEGERHRFETEREQFQAEKESSSENLAICKAQLDSLTRELLAERDSYEQQKAERDLYEQDRQNAAAQSAELRAQIDALQRENEQLSKETNKRQTQVYLLSDSQREMKETEKAYAELERKYKNLEERFAQLENTHRELSEEHKGLRLTFDNVLASQSWRLTAPLRGAMRLVKGHPSDHS